MAALIAGGLLGSGRTIADRLAGSKVLAASDAGSAEVG